MNTTKITIEIDKKNNIVTILSDDKEYTFESVALFAGNAKNKEILIKMFGASADAAWAYAQGFFVAQKDNKTKLNSFYRQCAAHICKILDPDTFKNEISADEMLNKWEVIDEINKKDWN